MHQHMLILDCGQSYDCLYRSNKYRIRLSDRHLFFPHGHDPQIRFQTFLEVAFAVYIKSILNVENGNLIKVQSMDETKCIYIVHYSNGLISYVK